MNNASGPTPDSALTIYGGLVADVNPQDLPQGSSPLCCDMDFTVGSVRTRDGLVNVYSYGNTFLDCDTTSGVNGGGINVPWVNPGGVVDASCATVQVNTPGGPVPPSRIGFGTNVNTSGGASVSMPIASNKVAIILGTAFAAYGSGDTLGAYTPQVFQISQGLSDDGGLRNVTVGMSVVTTRAFSGADTWEVNTTQFNLGASIVAIEYDGLNLGATPGVSVLPNFDSQISTQGTFSPSTTPTPTISAGTGFTSDAAYQYVESVISTPIAVCVQHMSAATPGTYPVTFVSNLGTISAGNVTTASAGCFIIAIAMLNGGTGAWGVCAYAVPLANPSGPTAGPTSQLLDASAFPCLLSIPAGTQIVGMQLTLTGYQSNEDPSSLWSVSIINPTNPLTPRVVQFPLTEGTVVLGGATDTWSQGANLSTEVREPLFAFSIQATSSIETEFHLCGAEVRVWYSPQGAAEFTYIKTFAMQNGGLLTLALDTTGTFWQEDVINLPDVLVPFYTAIEPETFGQSVTYDDREWIALSDLINGTDMPRQYNGQWVDRVSQVGPGAPPSVSATSQTYPIVSITQPPPVGSSGTLGPGISALLWSAGPGNNKNAGNVITIYYGVPGSSKPVTPPDPNIIVGDAVFLSGFGNLKSGADPNGTYIINSVSGVAGFKGRVYNAFTVTAPSTQLEDDDGIDNPAPTGSYNATLATLTTSVPIPNVQVGSQITVAGVTPPAWDGTWTVLYTPNAAQLEVTTTSLSGNVATYDYTLITGTAPVVGQQVTVTGTNNGNGIFNVTDAIISAVGANSFSIPLVSPNIAPAAETGSAIVNGTIFQFDPGIQFVGTVTDPIFGNAGAGGTVTQPGNLGAGQRQAVVFFFTRNDAITGCSPPVTFNLTEGANSLVCTNIPLGPPNVTKRGVAFTGANGAFFFYIPEPVTIENAGVKTTYTSTVVNDNISTQATFTFTDAVLLAGTSIDTEGNDLFEQIELGSCLGFVAYQNRLFAWGEQNKIQNLINLSFDGGYLPNPGSPLVPLGWTVDGTFGVGGQLTASPLFGNAYYIQNTTGSTIPGAYGMIEQTAFQDYNQVPIVNTNTQYGVRVTSSCPGGVPGAANLVIDLFSPSFNVAFGSFSIPLASMGTGMKIFTGNLLLNEFFSAVPSDLLLRIYATGLANNGDVLIDRAEPFDLSQPVLTTQLRGSYENNFEAFDDVTGNLGVGVENQQPVMNAFELFDNLYIVKNASFVSTTDNGVTEPDGWTVHEVSNKVGTPSIHGVDVGEGWALLASEAGLYLFEGGKPQKISPEIDPLWKQINWKYGYTLWLRNDTNNRRVSIGVPLPTPNQWMPQFPVNANPTQPNVVIILNYKELMTAGALASEGSIRQGYTGVLRSFQFGRRWSVWSIEAAYADFITRPDTTQPLFYLNDVGPGIFQQLSGVYLDNGMEIPWRYVTYPFLKSEDAQAIHAGLHNLLATYGSALVIGSGELDLTILPDTLGTPYGDALLPLPLLNPPPYGDTEFPLNSVGNRFFADFQPHGAGDWMELSRLVLTVKQNPWSPVGNTGNAY